MNRKPCNRVLKLAAVLLVAAAPALAADTYEVDAAHSEVSFLVRHLVGRVRGSFGQFEGKVVMDTANPAASSVEFTIKAESIDTNVAKRDDHLRSADFFDVAKYPSLTFASKKVEKVGDGQYKVTGDLTLRGVTKEVVLAVEGSPTPMQDPFGNTKLGGSATTRLNRKDFGLNWSKSLDGGGLVVGDEVDVTIDIELIKQ